MVVENAYHSERFLNFCDRIVREEIAKDLSSLQHFQTRSSFAYLKTIRSIDGLRQRESFAKYFLRKFYHVGGWKLPEDAESLQKSFDAALLAPQKIPIQPERSDRRDLRQRLIEAVAELLGQAPKSRTGEVTFARDAGRYRVTTSLDFGSSMSFLQMTHQVSLNQLPVLYVTFPAFFGLGSQTTWELESGADNLIAAVTTCVNCIESRFIPEVLL